MEERAFLSGNESIARGFYEAGGVLATGYAGIPITEALIALREKYKNIYSEISINENVALEVSLGASIAGARTIVIMKHTGLNIALDSLMTFTQSYINGGFLIAISSDAGAVNSYTEQDVRILGKYTSLGILAPSDQQEIKDFVKIALEISEKYSSPIMLLVNTSLCYGKSMVTLKTRSPAMMKAFMPNQSKYVMFPPYIAQAQSRLKERIEALENYAYDSSLNILEEVEGITTLIITSSSLYALLKEINPKVSIYKLGFIYPISTKKVKELSEKYQKIIVLEELYPFIENELKLKGIQCEGKKYFSYTGVFEIEDIYKGLIDAGIIQSDTTPEENTGDNGNQDSGQNNGNNQNQDSGENTGDNSNQDSGKNKGENSNEGSDQNTAENDKQSTSEDSSTSESTQKEEKTNQEKLDIKEDSHDANNKENVEGQEGKNINSVENTTSESKENQSEKPSIDKENESEIEVNVEGSTTTVNFNIDLNKKPIQTNLRGASFFAGCPHLPIMNILKKLKVLVIGDIGCHTIASYYPWNLSQITMNVGSSMGIIKGMKKIFHRKGIDKPLVAIIGDGAFFHSGMLGMINLLNQYRREESMTIIILDNKSIASGGWIESPGVKGSCYYEIKNLNTPMGNNQNNTYLDIDKLLKVFGFYDISVVDQFRYKETMKIIKEAIDRPGISIIVAKRPCVISNRVQVPPLVVLKTACRACRECLNLHCQAIRMVKNREGMGEKAYIDPIICNGCSVCMEVCPYKAIQRMTEVK